MIYCVGGVSGSGKSHLISEHPVLSQLPCVDIADFYKDAESAGNHLRWQDALDMLEEAATKWLAYGEDSIVLEAFFKPGSPQRARMYELAAEYGQEVRFIWCHAPRRVCRSRVKQSVYDTLRARNARLGIIGRTADWCFQPQPGEDVDDVIPMYDDGYGYYY